MKGQGTKSSIPERPSQMHINDHSAELRFWPLAIPFHKEFDIAVSAVMIVI